MCAAGRNNNKRDINDFLFNLVDSILSFCNMSAKEEKLFHG